MLLKQHRFIDPHLYDAIAMKLDAGKESATYWAVDSEVISLALDLVCDLNNYALKLSLSPTKVKLPAKTDGAVEILSRLHLPEDTRNFAEEFVIATAQAYRMETSLILDKTKDDRNRNQLVVRIKFYKKKNPKAPFYEQRIEFWTDHTGGIRCQLIE